MKQSIGKGPGSSYLCFFTRNESKKQQLLMIVGGFAIEQ
jgi:hypothetical protein